MIIESAPHVDGSSPLLVEAQSIPIPVRAQLVPLAQLSPPEYPGQGQFFGFSEVLVDDRRIDALVYYERHCRMCGVGESVWFHRNSPTVAWQIAGRRWGWIN